MEARWIVGRGDLREHGKGPDAEDRTRWWPTLSQDKSIFQEALKKERCAGGFHKPGTPTDSPFIEALNWGLGRERLSQHWFIDLRDSRRLLLRWE